MTRISLLLLLYLICCPLHAQSLFLDDVFGGVGRIAPVGQGQHVYFAAGPALETWTIQNGAQPQRVSRSFEPVLAGPLTSLAISGDRIFAVWYGYDGRSGGLRVYSIANPAEPRLVADLDDYVPQGGFKRPTAVAVMGDWLYLSDSENGLFVADLRDPLPLSFSRIQLSFPDDVRLQQHGDELIAIGRTFTDFATTWRIDVTNPRDPSVTGIFSSSRDPGFVLGDGLLAGIGDDLTVYDLSTPGAPDPSAIRTLPVPTMIGMFVESQLWLAEPGQLRNFDLADPAQPVQGNVVEVSQGVVETMTPTPIGPVLTTRLGRATLLDARDPSQVTVAAEWPLPGGSAPQRVAFGDGTTFVLDQFFGLIALHPETLEEKGRFVVDSPMGFAVFEDMVLQGSYAFLVDWFSGLVIVDVSDPSMPAQVATVPLEFAGALAVQGSRAYVGTSTNGGSIMVVDIAKPRAPEVIAIVAAPQIVSLTATSNRLFATVGSIFPVDGIPSDAMLIEFALDDPESPGLPRFAGSYGDCTRPITRGTALAIDSAGEMLALACGDGSMRLLDVSERGEPTLISTYHIGGDSADGISGLSVALDGSLAAFGHSLGIDLIDVANPAAPSKLDRFDIPHDPLPHLSLHGSRLFAFSMHFLRVFEQQSGAAVAAAHSGAWYHPSRSGEGWILEVHDPGRAALYWYTYDEQGGQRWAIGIGRIRGNRIEFDELEAAHGARFGDAFDPGDVVRYNPGRIVFTFDDCRSGFLNYDAFGEQGTTPIERLTESGLAGCDEAKRIDALRFDGAWYDPARSGEGMSLMQVAPGVLGMTWFTYDGQGNPYWMIGTGELENGAWILRDVQATRGARFGAGFDPADVVRFPWGEVRLELDCSEGLVEYASELPEFGSGNLTYKRLTEVAGTGCGD